MRFTSIVGVLLVAIGAAASRAQEPTLQVQGLTPAGGRTTLTESWSALQFIVANPTSSGRDARVVVLFPDQPTVQYARDLWVPARSSLMSWLPIGQAPKKVYTEGCELHALLYDRTSGQDVLVLPSSEERVRSRLVRHRPRFPSTALMLDAPPNTPGASAPNPVIEQVTTLVHAVRASLSLPEQVAILPLDPLPTHAEAYEGTDHIVVASSRLLADPAGARALRHWVEQGGRLWFLLDLVDPRVVASFLGDDLPFEVVDRVSLTTVYLHRTGIAPPARGRAFEQPVDLVRVLPAESDRVMSMANGWPAAFTRPLGRGGIVFTTLGARAWTRSRDTRDKKESRSPYESRPNLPVAEPQLDDVGHELQAKSPPNPISADDLRPLLVEEIGYSIISRETAAVILGAFLLSLLLLGIGLRRSRRPEIVGWLTPVAAIVTASVLVVLAIASRRAVPPTIATAAIAQAVPGTGEIAVEGLAAVYQPESGLLPLAGARGGQIDLDTEGMEGQMRRRVQTDIDSWHWDGLALPGGVRSGPFKTMARTGPISAVARFGPNGVDGRITAAGFNNLTDAIVHTPVRKPMALQFHADGTFSSVVDDVLPVGQYLAGSVLSDRQQRRQAVYRKLLSGTLDRHLEGRHLLLTWADVSQSPFTAHADARSIDTALLIVPIEFERPAPGTRVSIPQAFVPFRRLLDSGPVQATMDSIQPAQMLLRFQLPPSVRPLTVERATLHLQIRAPSRRVQVDGMADGQPVPLHAMDSPTTPIRLVIAEERLLRLDEQGGIRLRLSITNVNDEPVDTPWRIDWLGLDVVGRTSE